MRGRIGAPRVASVAAASIVLTLGLTACVPTATPAPTTSSTVSAPTSTPTTKPLPTLVAGGDAQDNLLYFEHSLRALLKSKPNSTGRKIIDTLVRAGFVKADMEVTPDRTSVGLDADNTEFSVKLKGTCIIGQAGNVGFHAFATTVLASGRCLAGKTRHIDW